MAMPFARRTEQVLLAVGEVTFCRVAIVPARILLAIPLGTYLDLPQLRLVKRELVKLDLRVGFAAVERVPAVCPKGAPLL